MGFSFSRLGHAQGWDLGVPWGAWVIFFPNVNQISCVSYLRKFSNAPAQFFGSRPLGALFSEHGHVAYQINGDEQ